MPKKLLDQGRLIYNIFKKNDKVLLMVLDACNWKILKAIRPDWDIKVVRSRGSNTSLWLERTFTNSLPDVVYISSNPFTYSLKHVRKRFKRVIDLYLTSWNEKLQTVRPGSVNLFVKEKIISGETKIIAHYMQPHAPFLVRTWLNTYSHDFRKELRTLEIYELARKRFDAREEFRKAYIKNLEIVTKYAESLIKSVKTLDKSFQVVITSDHSEVLKGLYHPLRDKRKIWLWIGWILGIYRFIGHEYNSKFRRLYEVPWVVF